ncbi:MAG TPA: NAD+ synthase [Thermoanaerobaculia bacterium]|nr:NAD+ synthase [Thermoanaerobaculia bacterium]
MKIFIAQINPTVGALESNAQQIRDAYDMGRTAGAQVVMVPELAVTGYPPRDLLEKRVFVDSALAVRDSLVAMTGETALIFGCVTRNSDPFGKPFNNVAVVAQHGRILLEQVKSLLPTYDVFDELRYFEPARDVSPVELFGKRVGVSICEDFWSEDQDNGRRRYGLNPVDELVAEGAEVLLNISASPFNVGKRENRYRLFREIALRHKVPIVYLNQVGGNDELLFDGSSIVIDETGQTIYCAKSFETDFAMVPLHGPRCEPAATMLEEEEIARALMLGLRDYITKCRFERVVIGLSGGIDSAVTAALAVQALGRDQVTGIAMPSPFSSQHSIDDAEALARNLGIHFEIVRIDSIYESYRRSFDDLFSDRKFDLTDENVQARIRGNLLMAWSNKTGAMVLSTGNKSELAVGYCTLYGDMAGGLAVLGDVYKTSVYKIAEWINRHGEVIPRASITKPPSAELRPNQVDQDSLPPYDVLDKILKLYIEQWKEIDEISAIGFDRTLVERIVKMVDGNEFKRRQAAPALRVSMKAFGSGREMPIAQRWRERRIVSTVPAK